MKVKGFYLHSIAKIYNRADAKFYSAPRELSKIYDAAIQLKDGERFMIEISQEIPHENGFRLPADPKQAKMFLDTMTYQDRCLLIEMLSAEIY